MRPSTTNLFRLDDTLIRAGGLGLVAGLGVVVVVVAIFAAEKGAFDGALALSLLRRFGFYYLAVLALPATLLVVGRSVRARERRITAIWKILRQRVRVSVPELIANSHFSAEEIEDAVKLLNTRGLGHYVWDRAAGTIQDGRLETETLVVEECDVCGGSVSVQVPIGFDRIPSCPYCGDPVSAGGLESRRKAAIEALRAESQQPARADFGSTVPFSIPIFVILTFVFWPAGVIYVWWKFQNRG